MTEFDYTFPESRAFVHTLRTYLQKTDKDDIAVLLTNSECEFSESGWSNRSNVLKAKVRFCLPHDIFSQFTEEIENDLLCAVKKIFPQDAGYDITELDKSLIIMPPPNDESSLENSASLVSTGVHPHDGLRFRSRTEIKIYEVLKKHNVLFFANATAVLGTKNVKREPDFLVCQDGKWGILEVMGEPYHPSSTAMQDHDRARLFKDYGLLYIEFYDATRCYNKPDEVVDDFLHRLSNI